MPHRWFRAEHRLGCRGCPGDILELGSPGLPQACMLAFVSSLSPHSSLPFCQQSVQHENTYRGSHSKVLLRREPSELLPGVMLRGLGPLGGRAAEELAAWSFLWSSREDFIMTTSCVVLCGLTRHGLTRWTCSVKQLETPAGHIRERQNGGWPGGGASALLGASALRLLGNMSAPLCVLPGPFTVKLFIGLLWSGGKILFPVEKCFALTVEYIQGDCCSCCFLVFLS